MLHHDNAYVTLSSPSQSFFYLKRHSWGSPAPILESIQKSVADMMKTISIEDFQRCVATHENYFEGDNIDVLKKTLKNFW